MNIISQNSDLGGLVYPFLVNHSWEIHTWDVRLADPSINGEYVPPWTEVNSTTLWSKDDGIGDGRYAALTPKAC